MTSQTPTFDSLPTQNQHQIKGFVGQNLDFRNTTLLKKICVIICKHKGLLTFFESEQYSNPTVDKCINDLSNHSFQNNHTVKTNLIDLDHISRTQYCPSFEQIRVATSEKLISFIKQHIQSVSHSCLLEIGLEIIYLSANLHDNLSPSEKNVLYQNHKVTEFLVSENPVEKKVLFIIDPQNDFHDDGSLAVPGANEDSIRIGELIEKKGEIFDEIVVTLDTHPVHHIGHSHYWTNSNGESPSEFTTITEEDIRKRIWYPVDQLKYDYAIQYAHSLEKEGKFKICIWPYHCLCGTHGHCVFPYLNEKLFNWSKKYKKDVHYFMKGQNPDTEMYSVFRGEVEIKQDPRTHFNMGLVNLLASKKLEVLVCGQALSHCVNYSVTDLLCSHTFPANRLTLLVDGSSPVTGYKENGEKFIKKIVLNGVKLGKTTDYL
uniref:Isochorismatase-like domain-containing protein n=1 Tax=viral metagenome TaxID=1070528 RepID=A0A6C0BCJ9_9ZZZZ